MAQKEQRAETSTTPKAATLMPAEFLEMGQKRMEALGEFQKEFFGTFEQANKDWLDRMKLEAELVSELTTKLTAAKSIPDAAAIYQEWMGRRMELVKSDAQKVMDDSQKLVKASSRILSNGIGGPSS